MRIHADKLTSDNILQAARAAGVSLDLSIHGSRRRATGYNVTLYGNGRTGGRWGNTGTRGASSEKSATWDEWGMFLELLFKADETVTVPGVYADHESFTWATGGRYTELTPKDQHVNHKWNFDGRNVTGSYFVQSCKCGAVRRFRTSQAVAGMAPGGSAESNL